MESRDEIYELNIFRNFQTLVFHQENRSNNLVRIFQTRNPQVSGWKFLQLLKTTYVTYPPSHNHDSVENHRSSWRDTKLHFQGNLVFVLSCCARKNCGTKILEKNIWWKNSVPSYLDGYLTIQLCHPKSLTLPFFMNINKYQPTQPKKHNSPPFFGSGQETNSYSSGPEFSFNLQSSASEFSIHHGSLMLMMATLVAYGSVDPQGISKVDPDFGSQGFFLQAVVSEGNSNGWNVKKVDPVSYDQDSRIDRK